MVLLKGEFDDNTARFWDRLRAEQLPQFLALDSVRGSELRPHRPFALPLLTAASPDEIRRAILYELSEALAQNRYKIRNLSELVAFLRGLKGTIPLFALPDTGPRAVLRQALEALLGIIDDIADEAAVRRLVLAVNLEQPDLLERNLSVEWSLRSFRRTVLIELDPLAAINQNDARLWRTWSSRFRSFAGSRSPRIRLGPPLW